MRYFSIFLICFISSAFASLSDTLDDPENPHRMPNRFFDYPDGLDSCNATKNEYDGRVFNRYI